MNSTTFSRRSGFWISGLLIGLASAAAVQATELVYTPVNPSFGGNPLNGTWLLNNAQALRSYYRSSPGLAQYPKELADLLEDQRFPEAKHHLRQLYPDPIGQGEWALQRGFDGRITGLNSPSTEQPLKQADFPTQWSDFQGMQRYSDWQFVAEKAFLDGTNGPAKGQSNLPQALQP